MTMVLVTMVIASSKSNIQKSDSGGNNNGIIRTKLFFQLRYKKRDDIYMTNSLITCSVTNWNE